MATLVLTDLAPGRTATLQLYVRGTNTTSGSLITGTSVSTTYSFGGVPATGDYDGQISGFTTPDGDRFPIRNAVGYPGVEWSVVEEIEPLPTTPNTCEITLRASRAGTEKQVRVRIVSLGSSGRLAERAFVNLAIDQDTDANGLLIFRLPWSSTPGVGRYRVRLLDLETNEVLHDRVCTVPDEASLDYEDLPGGALPSGVDPSGLLIREVDGTPSGTINTLIVPSGSLTVSGGTATLNVAGGSSLTVRDVDGTPSGTVTTLEFQNGTVAISGATATITGLQGQQGIQGNPGATGATGATGAAGPNLVSTATATNITGPIVGNGSTIIAGSFGTTAGTFCEGNDSRLSNARTPTAHNHSATDINSGTLPVERLSFTKAQLDTAVSDGNVVYVGDGLNGSLGATTPSTVNYTSARTTEITSTPTGTTQTITLNNGNHQTLSLASTTGNPTITLTVPTSSAAGTLIVIQHGTTPRSITWAVSSGSILWADGQPTWASDTVSSSRVVSWRWNGSVMRLAATGVYS